MAKAEVKKAGVLGWPVSHSLSPRLHGYWLKQYNIEGSYEALAVEPKDLKQTLRNLAQHGFSGVNLTVPHKEQAIQFVDAIDETAKRIGAINTIIIQKGKLLGSNTDVYGFVQNIKATRPRIPIPRALVIGAGGAARAVCAGLLNENVSVLLINRTRKKAEALAASLGGKITVMDWDSYPQAMEQSALLVNATTLGMKGQPPLTLSLERLPKEAIVNDIVYNPIMTPLLAAAHARGNPIIDGLGMLLYQAQPAFEAWFGVRPEVTQALREFVLKDLP